MGVGGSEVVLFGDRNVRYRKSKYFCQVAMVKLRAQGPGLSLSPLDAS
jgi:hypothetical protein